MKTNPLSFEICKKLKDAYFSLRMMSQEDANHSVLKHQGFCYGKDFIGRDNTWWLIPTLSELIEACGEEFGSLWCDGDFWVASEEWGRGLENAKYYMSGKTPEEAVANLYISLHS